MALLNRSNKATLRTSINRKLVREASVSTRQHHSWDRPDNLRCQLRYSDFLCTASATKFLRMIQTFMDSGIFFVQKAQQSFYSEQNQELTAFRFLLSFHLGQHNRQYKKGFSEEARLTTIVSSEPETQLTFRTCHKLEGSKNKSDSIFLFRLSISRNRGNVEYSSIWI